jgi:DNA transformation protein
MESPALMLPWARLAMEAALRARNAKPAQRARAGAKRPSGARQLKR